MKFFDKKLKVFFSVFFVIILVMFEFGILSGFRFTNTTDNGLTVVVKDLEKNIGWNYIIMSCLATLALIAFAALLGYKKNIWGLIAMELTALLPFLGFAFGYNVFYGWGTAHLAPMMYLIGVGKASSGVQAIFLAALAVIYAVVWYVLYRARLNYEAKNPW